jgi:hypothetical protein
LETVFQDVSDNTSLPTGLNAEATSFVPAPKKKKNNKRRPKKGSKAGAASTTSISSGVGQRQCGLGEDELREQLLALGTSLDSVNLGFGVGPQAALEKSWDLSPLTPTIIELVENPVDGHLTRASSSLLMREEEEPLNIHVLVYQPGRLNIVRRVELARVFGFHLSKRARFDHITVEEQAYLEREYPAQKQEWEMRGRAASASVAFNKQLMSQRRR